MTTSILDAPDLTDDQRTALALVDARPGLTVEDYAGGDESLCQAFYWLLVEASCRSYNKYVRYAAALLLCACDSNERKAGE